MYPTTLFAGNLSVVAALTCRLRAVSVKNGMEKGQKLRAKSWFLVCRQVIIGYKSVLIDWRKSRAFE